MMDPALLEGLWQVGVACSTAQVHPPQQVLEARVVADEVDSQDLLRDATKCL